MRVGGWVGGWSNVILDPTLALIRARIQNPGSSRAWQQLCKWVLVSMQPQIFKQTIFVKVVFAPVHFISVDSNSEGTQLCIIYSDSDATIRL